MKKRIKRAADLVTAIDDQEISSLLHRADKLEAVRTQIHRALPDNLRPHLKVANIRANCLVVAVDSPVWAARVRYQSREILLTSSHFCKNELSELKVQVMPDLFSSPKPPKPRTDGEGHLDRLAASLGLDRD